MKKLLQGCLAASALVCGGSASAADLPYKALPPAPVAYDWTGLYVGGHIGGGWQRQTFDDPSGFVAMNALVFTPPFTSGPGGQSVTGSSFLGGVQAGWNYQIGRLVLGSEFDISWTRLNTTFNGGLVPSPIQAPAGIAGAENFTSSTNWVATATTRLGVAKDTWLFYGKAGAAWTRTSTNVAEIMTFPGVAPATLAGSFSDTRVGWTVGVGLEWAFARNWTTKLEYDYIDFGTKVQNIAAVGTTGGFAAGGPFPFAANLPVSVSQSVSLVKWGANYKFDPGFLFF
jgi:outer membrane immunogenic protein